MLSEGCSRDRFSRTTAFTTFRHSAGEQLTKGTRTPHGSATRVRADFFFGGASFSFFGGMLAEQLMDLPARSAIVSNRAPAGLISYAVIKLGIN